MTRTLHFVFIALTLAASLFAQSADNDAWSLFRRRDYRAALEQMSKDVKSTPDSAALHDGIGWCHYFLGAYDDAEQAFADALARDAEYKWSKQGSRIDTAWIFACKSYFHSILTQSRNKKSGDFFRVL
jgi:tetratricopeptide (TPR) repeat protein